MREAERQGMGCVAVRVPHPPVAATRQFEKPGAWHLPSSRRVGATQLMHQWSRWVALAAQRRGWSRGAVQGYACAVVYENVIGHVGDVSPPGSSELHCQLTRLVYTRNLMIDLAGWVLVHHRESSITRHAQHSDTQENPNPNPCSSIRCIVHPLRLSAPLRPTPPRRLLGAEGAGDT